MNQPGPVTPQRLKGYATEALYFARMRSHRPSVVEFMAARELRRLCPLNPPEQRDLALTRALEQQARDGFKRRKPRVKRERASEAA